MGDNWKVYQDFKPVVLTKTKTHNNTSTSTINKSNIHINKPTINDDNEAHRIIKYSQEQIDIIREGRNALGLTQKQLAQKISTSLNSDFITNIENGKSQFNQKTFNTIKRILGIK
jgi:ribosome-binding protein aMBF1 (putative translation factor)